MIIINIIIILRIVGNLAIIIRDYIINSLFIVM